LHVAGCGLIDLALGAYLTASVICLTELAKRRAQADLVAWLHQLSPLALFFAGSAAACKYPGLIFALLPCLLIVIVIGKKPVPPSASDSTASAEHRCFVDHGLSVVPKESCSNGQPRLPSR
jgi:hypothetical protein